MDEEFFYCTGWELACYLLKNGATLIEKNFDETKGSSIYVFKNDYFLFKSLKQWEKDKQKCLF